MIWVLLNGLSEALRLVIPKQGMHVACVMGYGERSMSMQEITVSIFLLCEVQESGDRLMHSSRFSGSCRSVHVEWEAGLNALSTQDLEGLPLGTPRAGRQRTNLDHRRAASLRNFRFRKRLVMPQTACQTS